MAETAYRSNRIPLSRGGNIVKLLLVVKEMIDSLVRNNIIFSRAGFIALTFPVDHHARFVEAVKEYV